jgi:CBS domain-containing protein
VDKGWCRKHKPRINLHKMEARMEAQELLRGVTLDEYLKSRPPTGIVTLDPTTTLAQALRILAKSNILSAPVLAEDDKYVGFLDVIDILSAIFEEDHLDEGISRLAEYLNNTTVAEIPRSNDSQMVFSKAHGDMNLVEVIRKGFSNPNSKLWCHRLAVFDAADDVTEVGVKILAIVSQSDIIRFLYKHSSSIHKLRNTAIRDLMPVRKNVLVIESSVLTYQAFRYMMSSGATAAALVNGAGQLIGNLSPSDLRGLNVENLEDLELPTTRYLEQKAFQASGAMARLPGSLATMYGVKTPTTLELESVPMTIPRHMIAACTETETFGQVLDLLALHKVHRVWIVGENGNPVGVVSLTDVLTVVAL